MKRRKIKNTPIQGWQIVIDHINERWKKKKNSEYPYPFQGRDFRNVRHFCGIYGQWGIMALWDFYLASADDWTLKHGLSIDQFLRQLPRLVDMPWKSASEKYKKFFPDNVPKSIDQFVKGPNFKMPEPQFKSRKEWAEYEIKKKKSQIR